MSIRVFCSITNKTAENIKFVRALCKGLDGLGPDSIIVPGQSITYTAETNDRIMVTFEGTQSGTSYNLAMTCPKLSDNSASGFGNGGLQHYEEEGTPANFNFHLGEGDQASWSSGNSISYGVTWGECS